LKVKRPPDHEDREQLLMKKLPGHQEQEQQEPTGKMFGSTHCPRNLFRKIFRRIHRKIIKNEWCAKHFLCRCGHLAKRTRIS
jgi:hypothetical protein